ncbi:MAG: ADP-ribosylglycohydrolase family protein [Calditrichaceae bacterium]
MIIGRDDRFAGTLLGGASGDILGAVAEGRSRERIRERFGELRDFQIGFSGFGRYTDDTQMTIALALSIIELSGVDAEHCAKTYATFYDSGRKYGAGAGMILKMIRNGEDYRKTARIQFAEGSFGNGGAMRIAPAGLVYSGAEEAIFKKAVYDALMCTHVHPEAVDGAVVQARAVSLMLNMKSAESFEPDQFLTSLESFAETGAIKEKIGNIRKLIERDDDLAVKFLGNGIRASEAVSCALYAAAKYYRNPEDAVIKSVNFGGDTDTIGAMTGALMGALHGSGWIPARWLDNMENGEFGKEFIMTLAKELSKVDPFRSKN